MVSKKLITALLAGSIISSIIPSVNAESDMKYDYFVEAEKAISCNWLSTGGPQIQNKVAYSNGKYLNLFYPSDGNKEWIAEYSIEVENSGVYELYTASTPLGGWASPVSLKINSESEINLRYTKIKDIDGSVDWYKSNTIYLTKGKNDLKFIVKNIRSDGNVCCFFDCFALKKATYKPYIIKSDAPFQTFEESQELKFQYIGEGKAPNNMKVSYEVLNYEGNMIEAGSFYLKKGEEEHSFKLKSKKKGPYQIIVTCNGVSIVQQFLIVPDLSKRNTLGETPFGVDALPYGVGTNISKSLLEDYADLIKLSGVSWIRDRVYFDPYVKKTDSGYEFSMPLTAQTGKLLNDRNIKVLMTMDTSPAQLRTGTYGKMIPTDLDDVYKFWKSLAEKYDGLVNCWEIQNESDLGGGGNNLDGVDTYASMFKAAALGIIDSNTTNEVMVSPFGAAAAVGHSSKFAEYLYENEIYDYTNIENFHMHKSVTEPYEAYYEINEDRVAGHLGIQKEKNITVQNWDSESGISIAVPKGRDYDSAEQMVQAKYLATSNLEEFANGVDRRFLFDGISYQEGGKSWGMASRSTVEPSAYAAWGSVAGQTYALGEAKYINKLNNMPDNVEGYAFKDGDYTALALYAKNANEHNFELNLGCDQVLLIDMFGNETDLYSSNGIFNVTVNDMPIYIRAYGEITTGLISEAETRPHTELEYKQKAVEDSKRVVLLQQYDIKQRNGARIGGYQLTDDSNTVNVAVYNFNDHSVSGEIEGKSLNGWKISPNSQKVEIDPMSKVELTFEVIPDGFVSLTDDISFVGNLDCGTTAKSTIYANSKKVVSAVPVIKDGEKNILLTLENRTDTDKNVESISITVNDKTENNNERIVIEPKAEKQVYIPFNFDDDAKVMNIDVNVNFREGYICNFNDSIYYVTAKKKIDISKQPDFVMPDDGRVVSAMYYGKEDLYSKVWIGADDKNFYMTMIVNDDIHSAPKTGSDIWNNDGIQFSIGQGTPALGIPYYELGVSLSDRNVVQQYCWNDSFNNQKNTGDRKFSDCNISRNEADRTTTYEIAIPWENIEPVSFEDGLMAFSIVLNDNDGMGRTGYLEWGSGIGYTKDPSQFRTVLFAR